MCPDGSTVVRIRICIVSLVVHAGLVSLEIPGLPNLCVMGLDTTLSIPLNILPEFAKYRVCSAVSKVPYPLNYGS